MVVGPGRNQRIPCRGFGVASLTAIIAIGRISEVLSACPFVGIDRRKDRIRHGKLGCVPGLSQRTGGLRWAGLSGLKAKRPTQKVGPVFFLK
jgi:hypothetical protein